MTAHDAPLPDDWEQQDAANGWYVGCAAIGEQVRAGWRLPEDSPFRAREEAE